MSSAPLPIQPRLEFGFISSMAGPADTRATVEGAERLGFDSLWVGDHVAFPVPILDPLLQLAQAAAFSERLRFGTSVYLVPLRHPTPLAKQVTTLDHLTGGRLIFGVGVGGEFPDEFLACGVPVHERGARLEEAIPLLRRLVNGEETEGPGPFYRFPPVRLRPRPVQPGGPPIWCGGRADVALRRAGRMADGWISYVVTPEAYRRGLEIIAKGATAAGREIETFGTGHLLFTRIDSDRERALDVASAHLSQRYAMDFRRATARYAAVGRPEDVAERIAAFWRAGLRHVVLDLVGPREERDLQLQRFAAEVRPLLSSLG
ncbi:MAG: LLM class flavin-dependent oxidoreductase [Myxococcales bacterium]|nr:LLM class flavin-dependent oxidoreductase [Myxococcales bacterium]